MRNRIVPFATFSTFYCKRNTERLCVGGLHIKNIFCPVHDKIAKHFL